VSEFNAAATRRLLVAAVPYGAAVARLRLLRTVMAVAVTVLLLSHLLDPRQSWVAAEQVWRAAQGPLLHVWPLLQIGFAVGQRRWALVISVVAQ